MWVEIAIYTGVVSGLRVECSIRNPVRRLLKSGSVIAFFFSRLSMRKLTILKHLYVEIPRVSTPQTKSVGTMKSDIHPNYIETEVTCGCGEKFTTRSTVDKLHVDICSKCHPFYTGQMKYVDSAGRVEKFQKKYNWGNRKKAEG